MKMLSNPNKSYIHGMSKDGVKMTLLSFGLSLVMDIPPFQIEGRFWHLALLVGDGYYRTIVSP